MAEFLRIYFFRHNMRSVETLMKQTLPTNIAQAPVTYRDNPRAQTVQRLPQCAGSARPSWPTLSDSLTRSSGRSFRHTQRPLCRNGFDPTWLVIGEGQFPSSMLIARLRWRAAGVESYDTESPGPSQGIPAQAHFRATLDGGSFSQGKQRERCALGLHIG
jgi:hypothetical protein